MIIRIVVWSVVITGWLLYGLALFIQLFYAKPSDDPVGDLKRIFTPGGKDFVPALILASMVIVWCICWATVKEWRKERKQNETTINNPNR